jgi:hypothetical protein
MFDATVFLAEKQKNHFSAICNTSAILDFFQKRQNSMFYMIQLSNLKFCPFLVEKCLRSKKSSLTAILNYSAILNLRLFPTGYFWKEDS